MRISDWSSDVCSSDLGEGRGGGGGGPHRHRDHRDREARKQLAARCKVIRVRGASFETALTRLLRMRYEIDDVDRGQAAKVPPGRPWRRQSEISSRAGSLSAKAMPMVRSEEHTSELQSLMRTSYAVFCLKKNKHKMDTNKHT